MNAQPFTKHKIRLFFFTALKMLHNFTDNKILITYVIEIKQIYHFITGFQKNHDMAS